MNATQPEQAPEPRGNADDRANDILSAYFAGDQDETTPETVSEDPPEQTPETVEAQPETDEPEKAAPEVEEIGDYTVAELAEHFEVDPSALYATQMPLDDGTRVTFGQAKDELNAARRQLAEMEQEREQIARVQQQLQAQAERLQAAQGQYQLQPDEEEQRLYQQWSAYQQAEQDQAYWDAQGRKDPGQAALALQRLQGLKRDLEGKLNAKAQERQQKAQAQQQQAVQASQQEIAQRIPAWVKDQKAMQKDWNDISGLWSRFGMPQGQIDALWQSPAAMHLSYSFLELLRKLDGADPQKRKVLKFPALKSGKRSVDANTNKAKFEKLKAKAEQKGRRERDNLAADVLNSYLKR